MNPEIIHIVIGLITLGVTALVAYIGLQIKASQAESKADQAELKADLVDSQNKMRLDMDAKHSENRATNFKNEMAIAVHSASDEEQFKSIGQSLERIERKVDKRNGSE